MKNRHGLLRGGRRSQGAESSSLEDNIHSNTMIEPTQLAADRYEELDFLSLGIELAKNKWKIAFSNGKETNVVTIDARHMVHLREQIQAHREKFGLEEDAPVTSCYEAGQDGFWLHRWLREEADVQNVVVDAASIEDSSRNREAKTDRIDAKKLVGKLVQFHRGDSGVFSVVRVPSREIQDLRRLHRELDRLKDERTKLRNSIRSLLRLKGNEIDGFAGLENRLDEMETPQGDPVGEYRKQEIRRMLERYRLVNEQIKTVVKQREELVEENSEAPWVQVIDRLRAFTGIALDSAWRLALEAFVWREFNDRGEIGGCFGLDPTPYETGETEKEQGISKSGSNRLRDLAVQVAWNWHSHQQNSQLTRWFHKNFDQTKGCGDRKRGIVALARKLMIRLYKFSTDPDAEAPWGSTMNQPELLEGTT